MKLHLFGLLIAALVLSSHSAAMAADKTSADLIPLKLYWSLERVDRFDTSSSEGEKDAKNASYEFVRTEAYVFANSHPGMVPLKLYWNPDRPEHDYFLLTSAQAEKDAKSAGYQFVRTEGYVYAEPHPGTVALKLYWKGNDNFLAGTRQSQQDALADHYQFVRIEGYAVKDPQAFLGDQAVDYLPLIAQRRGVDAKEIVLDDDDRMVTPMSFKPPVEITIAAKTDSTNLRIGYAADQVIFNWELNPHELRVDGGPANGKHNRGAGLIPADKFVTVKWIVTDHQQSIYVDGHLRFMDVGDYSDVDKPVCVFPAVHSRVTVKSLTVRKLSQEAAQEVETRSTSTAAD
jgi:hypothetical protein